MFAIVGGTIIDGTGGAPIEHGVLVIQQQRIIAVGDSSIAIPKGAKRVNATGKYVIPGLMDANVHLVLDTEPLTLARYEDRLDELALEAAQSSLKGGVTTVFDTWGPRVSLIKVRDAINEDRAIGSRIYLAGNIVGLGGPLSRDFWGSMVTGPAVDSFAMRINPLWQEDVGPELLGMSPEDVRNHIHAYVRRGINFLKYAVTAHSPDSGLSILFSPRIQT